MKIQRFNEKDKFDIDDFIQIEKVENEINILTVSISRLKTDLKLLLTEYLHINKEKLEIENGCPIHVDSAWIKSFEFDISKNKFRILLYDESNDDTFDIDLNPDEIKDLLYFLQNHEIYKNAKKYNM